jgi:hypothetical protein
LHRHRASTARGVNMDNKDRKDYWIHCPICKAKTRTKVQQDTVLLNFPLFCPRCKKTIRIGVINLKLVVPDEAED